MGSFPGGPEVKASARNVGDPGSIPASGSSPGEGNGNPLQYSCLENPMEEEPGGLQSMGSRRVGHDWTTSLSLFSGWQFLLNSIKHWVIFPTQAWNPGLLHCREILYLLSHQEAQSSGDKLIFKEQRSLIFLSSCYFPNVSHRNLHFKCSPVAGWVWEIQDLIHVKYID